MFVKNLTNDILTVRKSGKVLKLKPGVNCVDGFWSAEFLKSIYGPQYIICYNEEAKEETEIEVVNPEPEVKAEVKADTEKVKEDKTEEVKAETEEKAEDTKVEVAEVKEEKTEAKKEEAKEKKATKNTAKNTTKNK